ncbi:NAD(P)-binding domain containing protein [Parasponia andersonii]|uniref:NAD(P)-binding domain containing protein n=1 Tax=Parasponia andersonii TaxID=3476 RepID=A0A2P5CBQ3_PARAD|nr:NAD(P)-binding domain containing protein [Parasponia andersonii]
MEGEKGTVCVTGGTGYVGSWLIMRLLDHGYFVRTTIRSNPENKKDLNFLTSLPGASEKLKIFHADLNNPESFGPVIEGCIGAFHVATPIDFENKEPEETVTRRAVDGAIGILKACLDSKTVKKFVYTSSSTTVSFSGKDLEAVDENVWTDVDYVKALKLVAGPYAISKTLTERAALEFSEKHGLEVVTLILPFVVGPFICPKLPGSVKHVLDIVLGKNLPDFVSLSHLDMVHVDDVAEAHIFLFEHHEAKGRFNCSSITISVESASELIYTKFPQLQVPRNDSQKKAEGILVPSLLSKKLIDSGFEYKYGVEEMLYDAIKCCKERGYL